MTTIQKKRAVVSYENMSEELAAAFAEKYPKGFNDYLPDIIKYPKPNGEYFYAVMIEMEDGVYLVKIKIKTDDIDELTRWLDGDEDDDQGDEGDSLPDDNISEYSAGDGDSSDEA